MRYIIYVLLVFSLLGCTRYINVPVYSCPVGIIPLKSEPKTKNLSDKSTTDEMLKAMAYDVLYLDGYSNQLIKLLEGYQKK